MISLAVAFTGLVFILVWLLNIQWLRPSPGLNPIRFNTALALAVSGGGLWFARRQDSKLATRAVRLAGCLVLAIGVLMASEYLFGHQLPWNDRTIETKPVHMVPEAAAFFVFAGSFLIFCSRGRKTQIWLCGVAAFGANLVAQGAVLDLIFREKQLESPALLAGFSILALSLGMLLFLNTEGAHSRSLKESAGGRIMRRLLPAAVLLPVIIGWIYHTATGYGMEPDAGITLMVLLYSVALALITLWTANSLDRVDIRLSAIVDSSEDAILSKSREGVILTWNRGAEKLYGYTAEEAVGRSILMLVPACQHQEARDLIARVFRGESVVHQETTRIRKDGTQVRLSVSLSPVRSARGEITGCSVIARDITARKSAEEKVREAARYTRSLIEASLDPLVTISPEGKITDVNEATIKATGVPREELIGTEFPGYFSEPDKAREGYRQVLAQGYVTDYPLALRHTSGRITHVLYNASIYRDGEGEPVGVFAAARDITARKQAELERQRLESSLSALVESTDDLIWSVDRDMRLRTFNQALKRTLELNFGSHVEIGKGPDELYPTEIAEKWVQMYRLAIAEGSLQTEHHTTRNRILDVSLNPISESGVMVGISVFAKDVTQEKRAEEALRVSEAQNRRFIEENAAGFIRSTGPGTILACNPAAARIFGYESPLALVGTSAFDLYLNPPDRGAVIARIREEGALVNHELCMKRKDGSPIWVLANFSIAEDSDGADQAVQLTFTDITEIRNASQKIQELNQSLERKVEERTAELRESERRVRRKLDSILSTEGDASSLELADLLDLGAIRPLFDDLSRLTGVLLAIVDLKGNVLVTTPWQDICANFHRVHPEACRNCVESDTQLSAGIRAGEFKVYKCKNSMWDVATPIMLGSRHMGNLFIGQILFEDEPLDRDVFIAQARKFGFDEQAYLAALDRVPRVSHERVQAAMLVYSRLATVLSTLGYSGVKLARAMAETTRANAELKNSVDDLERFTYTVSHDLRAPLRHLDGFLSLLSRRCYKSLDEQGQHYIDNTQRASQRMGRLIDELLQFSRLGRTETHKCLVDMNRIIDEVRTELEPETRDRVIRWQIEDLPPLTGDQAMLRQVMENLLGNALKFTRNREAAEIRVGARPGENGELVFSVEDNGAGFDMRYYNNLFQVFQRLHGENEFEGTGIGLASVRRIVERHGGSVWAEGKVNCGAKFYFSLPQVYDSKGASHELVESHSSG